MNNVPSYNPSVESENAYCQQAPNRWTAEAHAIGTMLVWTKKAIRMNAPARVLADLVRMGMVDRARGGWYRITDAGRAAFPCNPCSAPFGSRLVFPCVQRAFDLPRAKCDARPAAWAPAPGSTQFRNACS
jgi:hypothetical protein